MQWVQMWPVLISFLFGSVAADLNYLPQNIASVPELETYTLFLAGLGLIRFRASKLKKSD